jgi:hypothetical protein
MLQLRAGTMIREARPMKAVIFAIGSMLVAFVGMQAYLWVQNPRPAPVRTAEADEVQADEVKVAEVKVEAPKLDEMPPPRPAGPRKEPAKTPERRPEPAPRLKQPTPETKNISRPTNPYFVTEGPFYKGIPSRVVLHNISFGKLTIMLLVDRRNTGELFITRGKKEGHTWEVQVRSGSVIVLWDNVSVPQR